MQVQSKAQWCRHHQSLSRTSAADDVVRLRHGGGDGAAGARRSLVGEQTARVEAKRRRRLREEATLGVHQ